MGTLVSLPHEHLSNQVMQLWSLLVHSTSPTLPVPLHLFLHFLVLLGIRSAGKQSIFYDCLLILEELLAPLTECRKLMASSASTYSWEYHNNTALHFWVPFANHEVLLKCCGTDIHSEAIMIKGKAEKKNRCKWLEVFKLGRDRKPSSITLNNAEDLEQCRAIRSYEWGEPKYAIGHLYINKLQPCRVSSKEKHCIITEKALWIF